MIGPPETHSPEPDTSRPQRSDWKIAVCHLESLCGLPALNDLFDGLEGQIGLVLRSRRFGPRHGGVISQFRAGARRSGMRFTLWLGFDIVGAQIVEELARLRALLRGEPPRLLTLSALARRSKAQLVDVGDVNSQQCLEQLRAYDPDVIVVMNFDQILHRPVIAIPHVGVVNIHPSMLPALRGPCPAFWALTEAVDRSGFTIHCIEDEQIDAGRILLQQEVEFDRSSSVAELTTRFFVAGARALPDALNLLRSSRCPTVQKGGRQADYRGFPRAAEVSASVAKGVRLLRLRHILALIWSSLSSGAGRVDR